MDRWTVTEYSAMPLSHSSVVVNARFTLSQNLLRPFADPLTNPQQSVAQAAGFCGDRAESPELAECTPHSNPNQKQAGRASDIHNMYAHVGLSAGGLQTPIVPVLFHSSAPLTHRCTSSQVPKRLTTTFRRPTSSLVQQGVAKAGSPEDLHDVPLPNVLKVWFMICKKRSDLPRYQNGY